MADQRPDDQQTALNRFRVAMKFSLWTWALYWPGGGIMLLLGGLNVVSILVVAASFLSFILLMATGALSTKSSRNMKEFFLERPLYLIGLLGLLLLLAPLFSVLETIGLFLFSMVYLGGAVFATVRLVQFYKIQGKPFMESGVDQVFIALGINIATSSVIFLDTLLFVAGGPALFGASMASVAIANWLSLLYPALVLLATRGIREPMHKPKWFRRGERDEAEADVPIAASTKA